ncbi:NmrA family protein [Aspergillus taichungensis]|uniref:NmrA family protein n=1 Tax=Aspergillus taichungensis TaxID=482145 RepID=A0A2J5HU92_9EURO|nr:NmrA family protein [Aspergillus taichungensis]
MTVPLDTPKTITVYGATGYQGGPVVRSLLKNSAFRVRAITRKPGSEAAKALRELGAEIVQGNGWNKEDMVSAFSGSWGAYVNTDSDGSCFWDPNSPTEFDLGRNIIDAMIEAGTVKHLVYSSFIDSSAFTNGQAGIIAADMKAKIERYAKDSGYFETVCPLYQGWYMDIFRRQDYARALGGFPYFPDDDGFRTLRVPQWGADKDMALPWISLEDDYGDVVHGIFLEPENFDGRVIPVVSDIRTYPEVVELLQSVSGQKARYERVKDWKAHFGDSHHGRQTRSIYEYGRFTNGNFFGDTPVSTEVASYLKAKGAEARGKGPEERKLITMREWLEKAVVPQMRELDS